MALFTTGHPLQLADLPEPHAGPGELRLKVLTCGVCHTDLHVLDGELPQRKSPIVPGHQIVGIVDEIGDGAAGFSVGERAGIPWLHRTDGLCRYCQAGQENLCEAPLFTGYDVDGGFAEYAIAPAAFSLHLPANYGDAEVAPLLCAGIVGFRAVRVCGVQPGETVALIGFGASAHVVLQVIRAWECTVVVGTRNPEHQQLARELGASWAGPSGDLPAGEADRAIVFAPVGSVALDGLQAVRKGGTVAIGSVYSSPIPEMDYARYLFNERVLRSVTAATRDDARAFLSIAAQVPIRTEVETFPLEAANDALDRLRHSQIRAAAVLQIR
ncbi:MAG TPA: zinc-dependent alcohol dehydrogenase family protein [Chloroflexota bacterium]|nr:zinc-dependent alcohol dehydrogenase family protein [Chloroflexota bacterium]